MQLLYSYIAPIAIIPLFIFSSFWKNLSSRPKIKITKEEASFTLNKEILYHLSLGNRRLVSSFLWSYTLLESDIDHYKKNDRNSWMFNRFNTIARLDPKFYENYLYGGQYLSIIKDDIYGAEIIYNKGLRHFPHDYYLNFNTGFNYYFEMDEQEKAYKYFKKIQFNKIALIAAPYLPSLVSKMAVKSQGLEVAFELMKTALINSQNENLKKQYKQSLYAIRAEIDINCLESIKRDCSTKDYNGDPYIKIGLFYMSKTKWKKFRTRKRRKGETIVPP